MWMKKLSFKVSGFRRMTALSFALIPSRLVLHSMRLLIIEDERKTAALLTSTLSAVGGVVVWAKDGERGLNEARKGGFDALICDIMLPGIDGLSLVRTLRAEGMKAPVIMLSARGEVEQRVEGLDAGADDYLPKPFASSELLARLRSLVRRNAVMKPSLLSIADLTFDVASREVRRAGRRLVLSSRENLLLECLLRAEGSVVSRRDIIGTVWEYDFDPGTNLVDVYVRRLREKIDRDHTPALIQTVRGLGYALRIQP
jgi:DNA-binding response OmpR family regulator